MADYFLLLAKCFPLFSIDLEVPNGRNHMSDPQYDRAKAFRITKIEVMYAHSIYTFNVHDGQPGQYVLTLVKHEYPEKAPFKFGVCEHTGHLQDPCTHGALNIKDAAEQSIFDHLKKYHQQ